MNVTLDRRKVDAFFAGQLSVWDEARKRYSDLASVEVRSVDVDGFVFKVQHNPSRIVSSAAKVDAASIKARPCFLCDANRPSAQGSISFGDYRVLVNPFPVSPFHLTVPSAVHSPQLIAGRIADMVALAGAVEGAAIFYNGPRCGASAPDHFHFQAVDIDFLPLLSALDTPGGVIPFGVIVVEAGAGYEAKFSEIMSRLPIEAGEAEPKVNLLCYKGACGNVRIVIIPRRSHRPDFYGDGEGEMLMSPASVDLGGVLVAPRREDFEALDTSIIKKMLSQLCYSQYELDKFLAR